MAGRTFLLLHVGGRQLVIDIDAVHALVELEAGTQVVTGPWRYDVDEAVGDVLARMRQAWALGAEVTDDEEDP